jgi:hypothetical protein
MRNAGTFKWNGRDTCRVGAGGLELPCALLRRRERLSQEAVELFTRREEAEAILQAWDRDEPDQAGALRVEKIEFETSPN